MKNCPGCLREGHDTFCPSCRKTLFDGKSVSHVLPFTRPMYNQTKLAATPGRLSISGIQTKMPLRLNGKQLKMTESGGQYILKPIPPNGAYGSLWDSLLDFGKDVRFHRQACCDVRTIDIDILYINGYGFPCLSWGGTYGAAGAAGHVPGWHSRELPR
jgi:hypothetical protein